MTERHDHPYAVSAAMRAEAERMLARTDCDVLSVEYLDAFVWNGTEERRYLVRCSGLSTALETEDQILTMTCLENPPRCVIEHMDAFVVQQRMRRDKAAARAGAHVDGVLAERLRIHSDRRAARRLLFSMKQGVRARRTEIEGVANARMEAGRLLATIAIARGVSWRAGELVLKDQRLPETTLAALAGQSSSLLMRHHLIDGMTIRRARNTREGVTAVMEARDVDYVQLWRDLGGDDA